MTTLTDTLHALAEAADARLQAGAAPIEVDAELRTRLAALLSARAEPAGRRPALQGAERLYRRGYTPREIREIVEGLRRAG